MPTGVKDSNFNDCDACVSGKMSRIPFPAPELREELEVLHRIHSDLMGPIRPATQSGYRYVYTLIDHASRYTTIYLLKTKKETLSKFVQYQTFVERLLEKKIKEYQSDNGKEFVNKKFSIHLMEHGIRRRLSVVYTPQQNGLAERYNRTLSNCIRCLLIHSGLPNSFWGEASMTACYLRNRCPTSALNFSAPLEVWRGRPLMQEDLAPLRTFGCEAWAWIPKPQQKIFPPC